MVVVELPIKHLMVRIRGEVEHFHGESLTAEITEDNIMNIYDEVDSKKICLANFNIWDYVRVMNKMKSLNS